MQERAIDYRYALELVLRMNRLVEREASLNTTFVSGGFNLWQAFQASLFSDAKSWVQSGKLSQEKSTTLEALNTIIAAVLLFLISSVSILMMMISRRQALVFTEDKTNGPEKNDFRLNPLYAALAAERASYWELAHTVLSRETFAKLWRRGRPTGYLEAFDFLAIPWMDQARREAKKNIAALDLSSFNEGERRFVRFELEKFLSSKPLFAWRARWLTRFLEFGGFRRVFAIDDTRYYNELAIAANRAGVPMTAIQHGHFTKYHPGWLKMTDLPGEVVRPAELLVWSDYWKSELARLGTYFAPEEIVVAGLKSAPEPLERKRFGNLVLVPYEKDAPKKEVREYILQILACGRFGVVFKIRPDEDKAAQLAEYGFERLPEGMVLVRNLHDVLPEVGAVIGTYSTLLYEMVEAGKPVAIIRTSLDYGEGMAANGLAELIASPEEACERLDKLLATPFETLEERKKMLAGNEAKTMEETLRAIIRKHVSA